MMTINRSNVVLVIVVVAALAVASVVAAHGHGAPTSALATTAIDNPAAAGLADTSAASTTGGAASAVDPAKQEPTLNQFTSRDPFIQSTSAPAPDSTANPTSSPSAQPAPVSADIKIAKVTKDNVPLETHAYYNQKVGAALPTNSPVFKVAGFKDNANGQLGVEFELLGNYTVGGQKTFIVVPGVPLTVVLEDGSTITYYTITVELNYGEGSSSTSSSSSTNSTSSTGSSDLSSSAYAGHSIKALSIETTNGVPSATIVVDGTTYAALKVGSVVSTSWGQIKIVGINGPAQTVTVLHADVQVTLRVGQSVSK